MLKEWVISLMLVDYVNAYNEMHGWRTHRNDEKAATASINRR